MSELLMSQLAVTNMVYMLYGVGEVRFLCA